MEERWAKKFLGVKQSEIFVRIWSGESERKWEIEDERALFCNFHRAMWHRCQYMSVCVWRIYTYPILMGFWRLPIFQCGHFPMWLQCHRMLDVPTQFAPRSRQHRWDLIFMHLYFFHNRKESIHFPILFTSI